GDCAGRQRPRLGPDRHRRPGVPADRRLRPGAAGPRADHQVRAAGFPAPNRVGWRGSNHKPQRENAMRKLLLAGTVVLISIAPGAAQMNTQRFKPLTPETMTPEQKQVADGILSGPRQGMRGPFNALLRRPELVEH